MEKSSMNILLRSVIIGVVWAAALIGLGFWIESSTNSPLVDILFFEGGIFILLGGLSLIGGIPAGVSLKGMGRSDAQYIAGIQMEVAQKEKAASPAILKNKLSYAFNAISLLIGGGICIVIDIIMVMGM